MEIYFAGSFPFSNSSQCTPLRLPTQPEGVDIVSLTVVLPLVKSKPDDQCPSLVGSLLVIHRGKHLGASV